MSFQPIFSLRGYVSTSQIATLYNNGYDKYSQQSSYNNQQSTYDNHHSYRGYSNNVSNYDTSSKNSNLSVSIESVYPCSFLGNNIEYRERAGRL